MYRARMIDPLALLVLGVAMAVLAWDIALAGWIAARREAPRVFTNLTAFCGLLVAPALLVAVATGTETAARTISGISWLMPMIACAFVLQVLYSLLTRLVSVVVALPILLYDVVIAVVAIGDYLASQQGGAPLPLQAAVAARDVILGMTAGRAALVSPLAMLVPIIAPAYPARSRLPHWQISPMPSPTSATFFAARLRASKAPMRPIARQSPRSWCWPAMP